MGKLSRNRKCAHCNTNTENTVFRSFSSSLIRLPKNDAVTVATALSKLLFQNNDHFWQKRPNRSVELEYIDELRQSERRREKDPIFCSRGEQNIVVSFSTQNFETVFSAWPA